MESGQLVDIKFEAFPFTRYGTVPGKLISISNDAIIHEQLGPVYTAKVTLDNQQITVEGKQINLSPGMSASVEVKTGTRRIIEFFLSPLLRYKDESHQRALRDITYKLTPMSFRRSIDLNIWRFAA